MSSISSRVAARFLANQAEPRVSAGGGDGMVTVVMRWEEPEEGLHVIQFPSADLADLQEAQAWVKAQAGDEYGGTIASIEVTARPKKPGKPGPGNLADPWDDLATNVRYSTGEGVYAEDCPVFARHGIERS